MRMFGMERLAILGVDGWPGGSFYCFYFFGLVNPWFYCGLLRPGIKKETLLEVKLGTLYRPYRGCQGSLERSLLGQGRGQQLLGTVIADQACWLEKHQCIWHGQHFLTISLSLSYIMLKTMCCETRGFMVMHHDVTSRSHSACHDTGWEVWWERRVQCWWTD